MTTQGQFDLEDEISFSFQLSHPANTVSRSFGINANPSRIARKPAPGLRKRLVRPH